MDNPLTLTTPDSLASDITDALTRLIDSRLRHVEARCADLESVVLTQDEQIRALRGQVDACAELEDVVRMLDSQVRALETAPEEQASAMRALETTIHQLRRQIDRLDASGSEPDDEQIRASVRDMIRDGEIVVTLDYV
jgi:hypothetical protein